MVLVKITVDGVRGVAFGDGPETMEDSVLDLFPLLREELSRLDERIKREVVRLRESSLAGARSGTIH